MIEYSDMPAELARRRDEQGHLRFWAGSPAIHVFDVDFLTRVTQGAARLPFHLARKKVPHIAADGECNIWVAGARMDSTGFLGTFIEHLAPSGNPCRPDFNHDGVLNSQDYFDFLSCFFDAGCTNADFNADGRANSQDYFDFLTAFFAGC